MPEDYTGLNFGSYNLAELIGVKFPSVTNSYFHSLDVSDLYSPAIPVDALFAPADVLTGIYTKVGVVNTTFAPSVVSTSIYTRADVLDAIFTPA